MDMFAAGRSKNINPMEKPNPLEETWRASFSEQHQKIIRHLGGPIK